MCCRLELVNSVMLDNCNGCSYPTIVLVTIGFDQTTYSVREDAGNVTISVSVMSGTPVGDVIVTLLTDAGGTAAGRALETAWYERERERSREREREREKKEIDRVVLCPKVHPTLFLAHGLMN